jgi:hypothetical protein
MKKLIIMSCVGFLSSCASMSAEDCAVVDWRNVGYTDGVRGVLQNNDNWQVTRCRDLEAPVDLELYSRGYTEGVNRYCEPDNGYKLGLTGADYNGICRPLNEELFLDEYYLGLEVFQFEEPVRQAESDVERLKKEEYELEKKYDKATYWLDNNADTADEQQIRNAKTTRDNARYDSIRVRKELDYARQKLLDTERALAAYKLKKVRSN